MNRKYALLIAVTSAMILFGRNVSAQENTDELVRFPGGATTITETHDDWTVICEVEQAERTCYATLTLGANESRRPILSMEVVERVEGTANALLTLPFGLDLREGVDLELDDGELTATLPFSACTEQGCLVSIDIDADELAIFKSANALELSAKPAYEDDHLAFTIPLRGFASAFARTIELVR